MLLRMGRIEEGLKQERVAVALDPLAPNPRYMMGMMLGIVHRYDEAIAAEQTVLRTSAKYFAYAQFHLAYLLIYAGRYEEAEKEARAAATMVGEDPNVIGALVQAVADPVKRPAALKLIAEGKTGRYSLEKITPPLWSALLGANEEALVRLEEWRITSEVGELFCDAQGLWAPAFEPIRADPRYQTIMRSLGLPNAPVPLETGSKK